MKYIFVKLIIKIAVLFKISSLMNALYNLKDDLSQQNNLAELETEKLNELIKAFKNEIGSASSKVEQIELK